MWKYQQKVESRYQQSSPADAGARTWMTAPLISKPTAMRSPAVVYTRPARWVVTASAACRTVTAGSATAAGDIGSGDAIGSGESGTAGPAGTAVAEER
jgi:hypothetical protein